jgi:hypothetical protein
MTKQEQIKFILYEAADKLAAVLADDTFSRDPPEPPKPQSAPPSRRPCSNKSAHHHPQSKPEPKPDQSVTGFLRRLLPRDFDTGDLLIVLLLLLMAGDSCDDQNNALLTLALYFLM